jgi:hypothetical protein
MTTNDILEVKIDFFERKYLKAMIQNIFGHYHLKNDKVKLVIKRLNGKFT